MYTDEEWRPVVGYEGAYEVSDMGRVRSLDRPIPHGRYPGKTRIMRGRVLRPALSAGYPHVNLSVSGVGRAAKIHWLVAAAFIGPRPDGALVCHRNGDSTDNRVENLRYGTYSENLNDMIRHGRHFQVEKTRCVHGHEYTPENTIVRAPGDGRRRCRACQEARGARRWQETLARRSA